MLNNVQVLCWRKKGGLSKAKQTKALNRHHSLLREFLNNSGQQLSVLFVGDDRRRRRPTLTPCTDAAAFVCMGRQLCVRKRRRLEGERKRKNIDQSWNMLSHEIFGRLSLSPLSLNPPPSLFLSSIVCSPFLLPYLDENVRGIKDRQKNTTRVKWIREKKCYSSVLV